MPKIVHQTPLHQCPVYQELALTPTVRTCRNIIPNKDYQLPKGKKQIYVWRWDTHEQEKKTFRSFGKESKFDVKPLNALFSDKSFSTVENVATP